MAKDFYLEALERLSALIAEGWRRELREANVASLATADAAARPSVRVVNVIAIEPQGLVFLADINSGKIRQISKNPRAGMCFYSPVLQEQVIVEGQVTRAGEAESDRFWGMVPREKQVYTSVDKENISPQRQGDLGKSVEEQWSASGFDAIERPQNWYAFQLEPDRIEFWPTGWRRAHERIHYSKTLDGDWHKELIAI